jgi:clan AA aspartic protease
MGVFHAAITLENPREPGLKHVTVNALVDTGTMYLCIPEHIANQLKLEKLYQREVTLADGSTRLCPYVGPVHVHFEDRGCFTGALVLGDQPLMGAIAMEDMDLVVNPQTRTIGPNPLSPNIPSSLAK